MIYVLRIVQFYVASSDTQKLVLKEILLIFKSATWLLFN